MGKRSRRKGKQRRQVEPSAALARPESAVAEVVSSRPMLPAVGTRYRSEGGVEFEVVHVLDAGLGGGHIERDGQGVPHVAGPEDEHFTRMPLLAITNPSPSVTQLIDEIEQHSPKPLLFADTAFLTGHDRELSKFGHWADARSNPDSILICLNSRWTTEGHLLHELGHAWLLFVHDFDDSRSYHDLYDLPARFLVDAVRALPLDLKLNELLMARGFDMSFYYEDTVEAFVSSGGALSQGYLPRNDWEAAHTAHVMGVLFGLPHLFNLAEQQLDQIGFSYDMHWQNVPRVALLGETMAQAFHEGSYETPDDARALTDVLLRLNFEFLERDFDPARDLREWPPEIVHPARPTVAQMRQMARAEALLLHADLVMAENQARRARMAALPGRPLPVSVAPMQYASPASVPPEMHGQRGAETGRPVVPGASKWIPPKEIPRGRPWFGPNGVLLEQPDLNQPVIPGAPQQPKRPPFMP